jgi:xylulokinase
VPLVVGVDSSTSACKVQVHDLDSGEVVASGRAPHSPTMPPRSEQDPQEWEVALRTACARAGVPDSHRPAALAVAAQQHGLVVLDQSGEPLRPAKLWNDTESAPDAEALLPLLPNGPAGWAEACGSVPVASFTITKLHWLQRREPETLKAAAAIMLPHDWLTFRLTGRRVTDRGDASGTGYWSPRENRYRFDLLHLVEPSIAWDALVPEVLAPNAAAGQWTGMGVTVTAGTGDNMAASLGLGLRPGDLALSFGTSGTAFTVSNVPANDPTGTVAGFADATGRFLPLVCTMNATKVTDALARLLGVDHEAFDALALEAPAGSDGLVLVPYLDGERTPNRPLATGSLFAAADALGQVAADGRVLLVGGAARSPAYRRVVADLTGRVVHVPSDGELVAAGAAVQAAAVHRGCGFTEITDAWNLGRGDIVEPDDRVDRAAIRAAYADAASRAQ